MPWALQIHSKRKCIYKLKFVFLTGCLGLGGAEKQLFYIVKCLKEQNHNITVISLSTEHNYQEKIENLDIEVINVENSNLFFIKLFKIFNIVRKLQPFVFQSAHCYTNIYVSNDYY